MIDEDFQKRFNKRRKLISGFFVFNIVIILVTIATGIYVGISIFNEPELVGEFVGRVVKGFNENSK